MKLVRDWWAQPDHFDWLSNYLQQRNMTRPVRVFFGTISLTFLFLPVDGWLRRRNFDDTVAVAVEATWAVVGVIIAVLWFRAWPTKTQSAVFAVIGNLTTLSWSMLQSDHMFGLLICATLTFSGGYFALLHGPRFTVWNLLVAAFGSTVNAIRLIGEGSSAFHAILGLWIVMAMNTAAPLAAQSLCRALGADLSASELDPLTGLRNRRSLYHRVAAATQGSGRPRGLRVIMLDLDDFKRLNDTQGHSTGDRALVEVANVLRDAAPDDVMLFRFGGEEFLAVELWNSPVAVTYPDAIRARIAELHYGISASIGCVDAPLGSCPVDDSTVDALIARADVAMYEAKRQGGNRVVRCG